MWLSERLRCLPPPPPSSSLLPQAAKAAAENGLEALALQGPPGAVDNVLHTTEDADIIF